MLNILRDLNQSDAQILLSSTAELFLPNPGIIEPREIDPALTAKQQQLLGQIKKKLKIESDKITDEKKSAVLELLSKEITDQVLSREKGQAAKARLGERGLLRPNLYQVEFDQMFESTSAKQGIRKSYVIDVLRSPDDIQHLTPPNDHEDQKQLFSLFYKSLAHQSPDDPYGILVLAIRNGYTQKVLSAWRIYNSDVDLSNAEKPLDVLKSFTEAFGFPFSVGDSEKSTFKLYEKIKVPAGQSRTQLISIESPKNVKAEGHFAFKFNNSEEAEIAYAFAIDDLKYEDSLLEHGVRLG